MTEVKWETDKVPGVYKRMGVRGRELFRHVYRDLESKQVACSKHDNITSARRHQREMLVSKPKPATRTTLREAYDKRNESAEYAEATIERDGYAWAHIQHLANVQVGKITEPQVSDALKAVQGAEMRTKVRHLLMSLGVSVPVDRKPRTRAARMARAPKPLRTITADELARLVGEMTPRYQALVQIMAYQGLRPGEAVSLRMGDLDPLRRTLTIERSISGFTKTGEPRTLTLPVPIVEMLTDHIATFRSDADRNAPMFTTETGEPIATKNAYDAWARRHFREAAKRADVNHGLSPNDLRHYAVKFAIGYGANVYDVQNMLGHAKPSITLDIYGSAWEGNADRLASALDAPIREALAKTPTEAQVVRL